MVSPGARLARVEHVGRVEGGSSNSSTPNSSTPTLISMSFDRMGRRVQYLETCGSVTNSNKAFTYDGYLQIANFEHQTSNIKLQTFIWDPTEPIATRPLVWNFSTFQPFNTSTSYYTHDGNKNVSDLVASSNLSVAAHYEYAPFGDVVESDSNESTCAQGQSSCNPFCFSSEYNDSTLDLVYYNYRCYNLLDGRWNGRDLLQCVNLFIFLDNHGPNGVDDLGLIEYRFNRLNCLLNVTLKWNVGFNETTPKILSLGPPVSMVLPVKWTELEKVIWMMEAKAVVEKYFRDIPNRCMPPCGKCPECKDGVSVAVHIEYDKFKYDYKVVVVGYQGHSFRSNVVRGNQRQASLDRSAIYWTGTKDKRKSPKNPGEIQQAIIHEVGHMLGLEHPGQTLPLETLPNKRRPEPDSPSDYEVDYQSVMGRGMEMRDYDFKTAFCDKIPWNQPWWKLW